MENQADLPSTRLSIQETRDSSSIVITPEIFFLPLQFWGITIGETNPSKKVDFGSASG